ncbi:uncharacterized protein LOC123534102 isoform X3 [Mercenaria mercenaria]|uniref:uncharacterized protein LOC123534102 isoform X3 n=1 Tax=Mercenaria mercenaria TaxID=6596 RepID=UPI00234E6A09|nr:uncharacterized protein LOC123534102 isoform X3 [Mercenaria mercenaria]
MNILNFQQELQLRHTAPLLDSFFRSSKDGGFKGVTRHWSTYSKEHSGVQEMRYVRHGKAGHTCKTYSRKMDSGFASGGSTRDLLIDPLANQYVTESIIRQSRYGYEDIDDADILMTESKSEKEMKQKHKPHRKTSVDENMKSLTDPYYINMKQSPIRMNDVHMALSGSEDSQPTSGSSQGFLSVRSPSTVPSLCSGTQETDQTEDEGNTCLKTIEESSDESSVESTTYENLKFLQDEYLQDNKEEMISQKWIAEQPIGTFIIRLGTTTKKELCVNTGNGVKIYKVLEKGGKVYLSESRTFHTLDDLVNFYRFHDLPSRHIQQKLTRGYKSEK